MLYNVYFDISRTSHKFMQKKTNTFKNQHFNLQHLMHLKSKKVYSHVVFVTTLLKHVRIIKTIRGRTYKMFSVNNDMKKKRL